MVDFPAMRPQFPYENPIIRRSYKDASSHLKLTIVTEY